MIEDIVLENSSRNIDFLRQFMPKQYILRAAELIHKLKGEKGKALVGITCGFYVNGRAETDGPPGAFFLYKALEMLGFCPYIVTDDYCRGFFEGLSCLFYPDISLNFDLLISVERAGRSKDGRYYNMKKKDITDHTPPIDELFINAKAPTIGIGDGGNEIGMGNFYDEILNNLDIIPSVVKCDHLIISSVSNWGAYGLVAYLEILFNKSLLPSYGEASAYIKKIVGLGAVDGILGKSSYSVDGFCLQKDEKIIKKLKNMSNFI